MMRLFMIVCFKKCSFSYIHKCTLAVAYISSVVQHVYYYVGLMISNCPNKIQISNVFIMIYKGLDWGVL